MNLRAIILIAISIFAVRYLLQPGFIPTHDGEYHFMRFWQFEKSLEAGDYFPIWAPDLNSGYGLPLFNYHYPMPNYFGVLFHKLGFSYTDAFKLTLASFYLLGVSFFYLWSKSLWATLLFAWTPYWFVNLFVRGSIGEVMASAGFALVLWANKTHRNILVVLGVAFIVLSHNIAAMLFVPIVFLLNWKSTVLGILLSAYFWLPAILERGYVVGLSNINFADHFTEISQLLIPSWGSGFSRPGTPFDEMSQQLGLGSVLVGIATMPESLILAFIVFLTTRSSMFVWNIVPILQLLQYPWRLLMFVPFVVGALTLRLPKWFVIVAAIISILFGLFYTKPVVYEPRDDGYYLSRREFTDGTSSLGNSMSTLWTPWKRERAEQKIETIRGTGGVEIRKLEPTSYSFIVDAQTPVSVRVNTVYFPGWEVRIGKTWQPLNPDVDGLMVVDLPAGRSQVLVKLHNTWVRQIAFAISIASFVWVLRSAILKR